MLSASILLPSFCTCSLSSPFRSLCMTHSLIPSLFLCALGTSVAIRLVLIVWAIFIRQPSWCISSKYVELDYNFLSQSNIFAVKMRDICWKCGTYTENPEHMLRMRDICWKVKMRDICWKWGTYAENAGHMLKIQNICWKCGTYAENIDDDHYSLISAFLYHFISSLCSHFRLYVPSTFILLCHTHFFPSPFFQCGIELVDSDSSPRNITMKCGTSSLMLEYSQHTKDCLTTLLQTGEIYKILKKRGSAQTSNDKPVKSM